VDIRQKITDDIIAAMEAGTAPWRKGWTSAGLPYNASSGKAYSGVNLVILSMQPAAAADPRHLTLIQANHMGLKVRKGAKGVQIVKMVEVDRHKADRETKSGEAADLIADDGCRALVMKAYTVFNATQIEGMAPLPARACDIQPAEAVEAVVWGLQDTGMKLNFGASQPAYSPRRDELLCPPASSFHSVEDMQAVLLHECAHASGHPKRLSRLHLYARFGSAEYAREELRAELASAMMTGLIGLPLGQTMIESHAAYLSSWLDALRRDKTEIFRAAADAQRICDYLSERALSAQPSVARQSFGGARPAPKADGPTEADHEVVQRGVAPR
jgi:antirestriction protein ArdC